MSELLEVRLDRLPECWDSCGNCRSEEFEVVELLVDEGDQVDRYQPLLSWEAGKAVFELGAPVSGRVELVLVAEGDHFECSDSLLLLKR